MEREDERLIHAVAAINSKIMGFVLGVLFGFAILVATLWLVLRGGDPVGPHLALLAEFFPGYSVTPFGSLVGLLYGFLSGYLIGWLTAWLYNRFVYLRGD